jgi:hypothetical protein
MHTYVHTYVVKCVCLNFVKLATERGIITNLNKMPCNSTRAPRGGTEVQLLSVFNLGDRLGWVDKAMPRPHYPPDQTRCLFYKGLGGPEGRSGRMQRISPLPGFDPQTVQPVANSHTTELSQPTYVIPY